MAYIIHPSHRNFPGFDSTERLHHIRLERVLYLHDSVLGPSRLERHECKDIASCLSDLLVLRKRMQEAELLIRGVVDGNSVGIDTGRILSQEQMTRMQQFVETILTEDDMHVD